MKILIFSTAYYPHIGGAEISVKEVTDRLTSGLAAGGAAEPLSFDMLTVRLNRKDARKEKVGNIMVHRVGWGFGRVDKLLFPFRAARLANKLHKERKYQVVWSIMASFSGFAALFFKKKNPEVKFLLTLQEGDDLAEVEHKARWVKGWFRQIFQKADYIQCISNYLADWAKKMGAKSVKVVPNGIVIGKSQIPNPKSQRNHKSQISKFKVILTTSRLVKKNGIDDLVKAISKLSTVNCKLIICGSGEQENELKQLTKELQIEDRVKFVGFVNPEELPKYYAIADVFCRPSISEGLGISFLEAMHFRIPVIATPVGGIPDFLEDGKTGWFCKVKSPKSIAEKVQWILDEKNKDEVKKVVENAKAMVEKKYNWDIIAPQMKNIFNKLK